MGQEGAQASRDTAASSPDNPLNDKNLFDGGRANGK